MTLPTFLEPENARITIPVALGIGYALYHWWRWRMMHPKIVIEELPQPSPVPMPAGDGEVSPEAALSAAREEKVAEAGKTAAAGGSQRPDEPRYERQKSRWEDRLEYEQRQEEFDAEAFNVRAHNWAFRKATHGRPEYFVRLGEYAWRRGAMIEAHYWVSMAKFHGVVGLDDWLGEIRRRWILLGRQMEDGYHYSTFPYERRALAHQYMMLACGFSAGVCRLNLMRMAEAGDREAAIILNALDK